MALIKDGWFQDTWWPSRWWQEDWWLEYGTAIAGGDSARYYYMRAKPRGRDKKSLLLTVQKLLSALKEE